MSLINIVCIGRFERVMGNIGITSEKAGIAQIWWSSMVPVLEKDRKPVWRYHILVDGQGRE